MNNTSAGKIFDLSILEAMEDPEYTRDMIRSYLSDTPSELKKMMLALQKSMLAELAKIAHKLKSGTAVFQPPRLVVLLDEIEKNAKSQAGCPELKQKYSDIEKEYNQLAGALRSHLRELEK